MKTLTSIAALIGSLVVSLSAQAATLTASNSVFGNFDASSGTRNMLVTGAGRITDLNLTVDFAKCDGENLSAADTGCRVNGTPYLNEILFTLRNEAGTAVDLIRSGTYAAGRVGGRVTMTFDDEATGLVGGSVLTGGAFRPVGLLSSFDGLMAAGNWTLTITDTVNADQLAFYSARLDISTDVPEPASLMLVSLGLLGAAAARRRYQA